MKLREFEGVAGKRDQYQIDPRLLKVRPGFNIRDLTTPAAREKLDVLKAQIKAEGVLEAIEIEFDGDTPWINEGHRRHIVVMELIEEGHDFKSVPCIQERLNIKEDKRTLHMLMRSKEDYEPLEYAKGIDRMVNVYGWDRGELAEHLGFKSKASIDGYLDMLAMPEPVKEHVRQGNVSATLAKQISKNADPELAAKLIQENLDENKKIVGTKNRRTKVTRKTLERGKAKPEPKVAPVSDPPKTEPKTGTSPQAMLVDELHEAVNLPSALAATSNPQPQAFSPLSDETPPQVREFRDADEAEHEPHPQLQTAVDRENGHHTPAPVREFPAVAFEKPRDGIEGLLLKFLNADVLALATMHTQLTKEHQEAAAQDSATDAQHQLCVASDVIGALRFPDEWESAKASSELAAVA